VLVEIQASYLRLSAEIINVQEKKRRESAQFGRREKSTERREKVEARSLLPREEKKVEATAPKEEERGSQPEERR